MIILNIITYSSEYMLWCWWEMNKTLRGCIDLSMFLLQRLHVCFPGALVCSQSNRDRWGLGTLFYSVCSFSIISVKMFAFVLLYLKSQFSVQHGSCLNHEHTYCNNKEIWCFSQIWNWQIYHRGGSGLHSGQVHSARQAAEGDEVSYSWVWPGIPHHGKHGNV